MPAMAAATASRSSGNRKTVTKKLSSRFQHLHSEKEKLEKELTTKFPAGDDIKFSKNLELLMMDGSGKPIVSRLIRIFIADFEFSLDFGAKGVSYTIRMSFHLQNLNRRQKTQKRVSTRSALPPACLLVKT